MNGGTAFAGYEEGPILFRPTYRYDIGTDTYDTSEKMRIPAWTGKHLKRLQWLINLIWLILRPYTVSWKPVGSGGLLARRADGVGSSPGLRGLFIPLMYSPVFVTPSTRRSSVPKFTSSIRQRKQH